MGALRLKAIKRWGILAGLCLLLGMNRKGTRLLISINRGWEMMEKTVGLGLDLVGSGVLLALFSMIGTELEGGSDE